MLKEKRIHVTDIEMEIMLDYRNKLLIEMKKMGASDRELMLIQDATIRNAIRRKRKPEDVAWAILQ